MPELSARPVSYVDRFELEREIVRRREDEDSEEWEDEAMFKKNLYSRSGCMLSEENVLKEHKEVPFRPPLWTD